MRHVATKNERDRIMIEALVRKYGGLSRGEIHELTHLQRSDISHAVRDLLQEGRLIEAGRAKNPLGRKQVVLHINGERGFVVGVGFNAENVVAGTLNLRTDLKSLVTEPTRLDGGEAGLVEQLLSCAHKALRQAGVESGLLIGVGVAGSGLVNTPEGTFIMSSTLDFMNQVPLQEIFEKEFGAPALVENITRAKTVAERCLGAGECSDDLIYLEYGTGIGAGIMIAGELLYGFNYAGGEFGHTHMIVEGPACKCGSFGCLEAIVGHAALEARIRKAIAEGAQSEVRVLVGGDLSKISGLTVLEAANLGDKTCMAIVEQVGNYLGLGLANLVNLFNPSLIVLDRRLTLAGEGLLDHIVKVIRRQALSYCTKDLVVRFGKLGVEASAVGVGSMVLDKHFEIPALKLPRFMVESVAAPPVRSTY